MFGWLGAWFRLGCINVTAGAEGCNGGNNMVGDRGKKGLRIQWRCLWDPNHHRWGPAATSLSTKGVSERTAWESDDVMVLKRFGRPKIILANTTSELCSSHGCQSREIAVSNCTFLIWIFYQLWFTSSHNKEQLFGAVVACVWWGNLFLSEVFSSILHDGNFILQCFWHKSEVPANALHFKWLKEFISFSIIPFLQLLNITLKWCKNIEMFKCWFLIDIYCIFRPNWRSQ